MKSRNMKRSVLRFFLVLFASLVTMTSQVFALKLTITPNPIYWGETSEVSIKPYIRKYSVIGKDDPDVCGFEIIDKNYIKIIKSVKPKVFDGRLYIVCKPSSYYRQFKVLRPYFVATLPDGQEKVKDKEVYSFRRDATLALELVCNAQKPIKWDIENKKVASFEQIDQKTIRLIGNSEGTTKLTATYMGYDYSVGIHVLAPKSFADRSLEEVDHMVTDIKVWLRNLVK